MKEELEKILMDYTQKVYSYYKSKGKDNYDNQVYIDQILQLFKSAVGEMEELLPGDDINYRFGGEEFKRVRNQLRKEILTKLDKEKIR